MDPKTRLPNRQYNTENLKRAYEATKKGMSVYRAARCYSVPESTLRDRTRGYISIDAKPGIEALFNSVEEGELVKHLKYMANIGYGYSRSEVKVMARDYALSLGKHVKSTNALSDAWFYNFIGRWPDLKCVMPQKLSIYRAKSASNDQINNYFKELGTIITSNDLSSHPESIYNIDETGVSTEHKPSKIICGKNSTAQSVTSARSNNVTIIAGGNALGNHIPPYYVFPGKRWNTDFLQGAPAGSNGEVTESGWSNSDVFYNYLTKHFAKFVKLSSSKDGQKVLVLYDGHKSHIQLTLTRWAERNNVILYVLPPHTSHITQPLDIGIFGPFKSMYNFECQVFMRQNPGLTISKYNIAQLSAKPYVRSLRPENLVAAFEKAGIHPFNRKAISCEQVAPAVIYANNCSFTSEGTSEKDQSLSPEKDQPACSQHVPIHEDQNQSEVGNTESFFCKHKITNVAKPKRKFVPPFIGGNLSKKANIAIQEQIVEKKKKNEQKKVVEKVKPKNQRVISTKQKAVQAQNKDSNGPKASTSGMNKHGKAIELDSSSDSEMSVSDEELCCICNGWQPEQLRGCSIVCFVTWGKCDFCPHWTHLKFCSDVKVLRRDSIFRCPHCPQIEE